MFYIYKVVYMDEPSTGLDPASRNNLWNVVKRAKQDRAIILTSNLTLQRTYTSLFRFGFKHHGRGVFLEEID